jgi:ankyrin repeat domain-containing protein 50
VNDTQQREAAIDGLKYISTLVRRYIEIERIYLQAELVLRGELEVAVAKLYKQILEYQARAACQFDRNTAHQIARNIGEVDSWANLLDDIKASDKACTKVREIVDVSDQRTRTTQLEDLLEKQTRKVDELLRISREQDERLLTEIKAMRKDQRDIFENKEEEDCLACLRTTAYEEAMEKNPERVPGTCEWFLRHPRYLEWLNESTSPLLWVTADPGCGKSVLSKFLVDDYRSWMWKDTSICYFFFKDDSDENRSATNALCAILHQLFRQNHALLRYAVAEYKINKEKLPLLSGSLWSILIKAAADPNSGAIICIIDALDECAESSCERLVECLANYLSIKNATKLKFLVTSRPNEFLKRIFIKHFSRLKQDPTSVKLMGESDQEMEEISAEITLVIGKRVDDFKDQRNGYGIYDDVHDFVLEQLKKIENRTYLWMSLIFPELEEKVGYATDQLLEAIHRIPPSVDKAYERILEKSSDRREARGLLHIVCGAARPLTLIEMNRVLSIHDDGRLAKLTPSQSFAGIVRGLCGLFISIKNEKIYLIHQTAKEFLVRENVTGELDRSVDSSNETWKHSLGPTESNLILAKICISYLLSPIFESDPLAMGYDNEEPEKAVNRYIDEHDLLDYSASHWATHFRAAKTKETATLKLALKVCDTRPNRFRIWFQVYWKMMHYPSQVPSNFTELMVGSYIGLEAVVELLLAKERVDPDSKDNKYSRTPLSYAAESEHEAVVKLLLATERVDPDSKDKYGGTPLSYAARNGHEAVVKLLLATERVDPDSKDDGGGTPLLYAARNGHEAVVKLLLATERVDPDSKDKYGGTPLSYAARNGHEAVVKLLQPA